jgi:superfamily II DNA/RNA helicase
VSTLIPAPPVPGQLVHIRQRQWLVEETTPAPQPGQAALVRLACVDDDAQGEELAVLWECEVDPEILTAEAWERLGDRGFDPPDRFAAYLHTLRWSCVTATDPRLFQAPFRAGIRLDAYQLDPLRKALLLPRVNLFIADDVGLGKTIEAGLIARELLLRKKAREIVVACPPSMLQQWHDELLARFGLDFAILDRDYVMHVRRERGYGVNPWATHTRFLISHRLLIDEDYAAPLRDWLGELKAGALLILDEAHHAAPSSGAKYAIDSKITRAVRDLAGRFEHRLFLSATPHNGHSNSFSALLEILDPQRFCRGVKVNPKTVDDVMVRRLKEDVREVCGGFPKRRVVQVDIDGLPPDAPELVLPALLDEYGEAREARFTGAKRRVQAEAKLVVSALQHRLLSSVEAFARTLRVHRRSVEQQWAKALAGETATTTPTSGHLQTDLLTASVDADDDRADLAEDVVEQEDDAQVEAASVATAGPVTTKAAIARERELLDRMERVAQAARGQPDARMRELVGWIRTHLCADGRWNRRRLIIFTEWDATNSYLRKQLEGALADTDRASERIEVFHGPTLLPEREELKRAFNADPDRHPVRILLATDAAREGLNLQTHCADLFHFDVPWNPSRLEQRNGRIDRKLQREDEVRCHYFFHCQRPEDRVLKVLVEKTKRIRAELGSLAPVVEARLEQGMREGIRRRDVDAQVKELDAADLDAEHKQTMEEELEQARERQDKLKDTLDRLRTQLEHSQRAIGLSEAHFRASIDCALGLVGASRLTPDGASGDGPPGGRSRRSTASPASASPGRTPWTPCAHRGGVTRSPGSGDATRRSAPWCSVTRGRWTRRPSTCTWSSAWCSDSSVVSSRRASCTTISRARAWRRPPTPSRA